MSRTPGPWFLDGGDDADDSVGLAAVPPSIFAVVPDMHNETVHICTISQPIYQFTNEGEFEPEDRWHGDAAANGHLIAAAPAMLAMLERIASVSVLGQTGCVICGYVTEAGHRVGCELKALIADAKGGSK